MAEALQDSHRDWLVLRKVLGVAEALLDSHRDWLVLCKVLLVQQKQILVLDTNYWNLVVVEILKMG